MPKPFDSTLNSLIDDHLPDWAAFLAERVGLPTGPVEAIDSDLSATLQADRLFRIECDQPYLLHLELESSGRLGIPTELLRYNVAALGANGLPVSSVVLLLRPKATASDLTGELEVNLGSKPYLIFRYTPIRLWLEPFETVLNAGLGIAPLALLTNEAAANLDSAFEKFCTRLQSPEIPKHVAESLLGSTYVLAGLRYNGETVANLYRSLSMTLEDSSTYQMILEKGIAKGEARGVAQGETRAARNHIARLGAKRFGPAPKTFETKLNTVSDLPRLERMVERVLDATGWDDLLATE